MKAKDTQNAQNEKKQKNKAYKKIPQKNAESSKTQHTKAHKNTLESHILKVASRLFSTQGYAATSIRAIATQAGANLAMIHYYFGSKEGLYKAVLKSQVDFIYHAISMGRSQNSAKEALKTYALTLVEHARNHSSFAALIANEASNMSEIGSVVLGECLACMLNFVHDSFVLGVDLGEFRADISPLQLSFHFGAIVNFAINSLRLKHSSLPLAQIPDDYAEYATNTLFSAIENR